MFATDFEYLKATSVAQALQLLGTNPEAKLMAGGHSLIPLMKLRQVRAPAVIDIGGLDELRGISINNGTIHIGALTTHREIETSPEIAQACHIMIEVAGSIGDPQVRNRGTIGGNVVHTDPASDWPTVLTALRAEMVIQGGGGLGLRGARYSRARRTRESRHPNGDTNPRVRQLPPCRGAGQVGNRRGD